MRPCLLLLITCLSFALLATAANADRPGGQSSQKIFSFVGVTDATTDGDAGGYFGLARMCEAEFGPAARACTYAEAVDTVSPPVFASEAWVSHKGSGDISTRSSFDCGGWRVNTGGGTSSEDAVTILPDGSPSGEDCNVPLPVACCAWVEIPN